MTECPGPVRGVISIGGENPFGEAPFEIKDSLSIFEAARIASGRHPAPRFLEGEDMAVYWRLIAAGSDRQDWRRVRPQRSVAMFRAIMDAIEQDKITPVILIYLIKPTPGTKGALDWRFTRIKTADVERLCWKLLRPPTEELAGEPRENSLPTIPAAEPLAIGAQGGDEAPDDIEAECRQWLAAQPEDPRLKRKDAFERFNWLRRKANRKIIGEKSFLRAWKKSAPLSWHASGRLPGT
jgi:hypothetical protein